MHLCTLLKIDQCGVDQDLDKNLESVEKNCNIYKTNLLTWWFQITRKLLTIWKNTLNKVHRRERNLILIFSYMDTQRIYAEIIPKYILYSYSSENNTWKANIYVNYNSKSVFLDTTRTTNLTCFTVIFNNSSVE